MAVKATSPTQIKPVEKPNKQGGPMEWQMDLPRSATNSMLFPVLYHYAVGVLKMQTYTVTAAEHSNTVQL